MNNAINHVKSTYFRKNQMNLSQFFLNIWKQYIHWHIASKVWLCDFTVVKLEAVTCCIVDNVRRYWLLFTLEAVLTNAKDASLCLCILLTEAGRWLDHTHPGRRLGWALGLHYGLAQHFHTYLHWPPHHPLLLSSSYWQFRI